MVFIFKLKQSTSFAWYNKNFYTLLFSHFIWILFLCILGKFANWFMNLSFSTLQFIKKMQFRLGVRAFFHQKIKLVKRIFRFLHIWCHQQAAWVLFLDLFLHQHMRRHNLLSRSYFSHSLTGLSLVPTRLHTDHHSNVNSAHYNIKVCFT